jgi:hypothetical protein
MTTGWGTVATSSGKPADQVDRSSVLLDTSVFLDPAAIVPRTQNAV